MKSRCSTGTKKAHRSEKKETLSIFGVFVLSTFISTFIISKVCTEKTIFPSILALSVVFIIITFINVITQKMFPKKSAWTLSKVMIIPELMLTSLMFTWKPLVALVETILVVLLSVFCIRHISEMPKTRNHKIAIKRVLRMINVNIVLSCIVLLPGIFILTPHLLSSKPLQTISSHNIPYSTEQCVSARGLETINTSDKVRCIEELIICESAALNMGNTPNIKITYLPSILYGYYSREDDCITINAGIIQSNDVKQLIDTLSHELYHRYEYLLVENYYSKSLDADTLNEITKERIERYALELENYKHSGITPKSYKDYYDQICESDARAFADRIIVKYCSQEN